MPRLRVGVLGLGSWGMEHLRAWMSVPGVAVVAVCDRDQELCGTVADAFGIDRRYATATEMAGAGELDVVSVAGAELDRLETAQAFFDMGIHALVEKPLALDLTTARRVVEAARDAGVILMTGHVLRFDPRFVVLKHRLQAGALGQVRSIYARRLNLASAHEKYGRAHPALMAQIHDIDLACWYFGAAPTAVRAYELPQQPAGGAVLPGVLWSILEFTDGIAVLEHAWALPDPGGVWLESETEVIASEGVARIRTPSDAIELLSTTGHERFDPAVAAVADRYPAVALKEQLSYLAACVMESRRPERLTTDDALRALETGFAVVEAAGTGAKVHLTTPVGTGKTNSA